MDCPRCKTEADEGTRICRACHAPLGQTVEPAEFVTILETYNAGDLMIIKSMLDSEGIDYYVLEEMSNSFIVFPQPYILRVRSDQTGIARELLADFL